MSRKRSYLCLILLVLLVELPLSAANPEKPLKIIFYGMEGCNACTNVKGVIEELFPDAQLTTFDIVTNKTAAAQLNEIYVSVGIKVSSLPVVLLIQDAELRGVVMGVPDIDMWSEIKQKVLNSTEPPILAYSGILTPSLSCPSCFGQHVVNLRSLYPNEVDKLEGAIGLKNEASNTENTDLGSILLIVALSAIVDSVNPCIFLIFTLLITLTLAQAGKQHAIATGSAFIAAIFVSYYLIGVGLTTMAVYILYFKYVAVLLTFYMAARTIYSGLRGSTDSSIPGGIKNKMLDSIMMVRSKKMSITSTFFAALFWGFSLLPCTGGPYLLVAVALAKLGKTLTTLALLALYNVIFLAPMVIILLVVVFIEKYFPGIRKHGKRKLNALKIACGLLLMAIGIYTLVMI